jgi:REP element-mobilizing transposase RayT
MPRAMRVEYPGAIYHVMDRGDRREDIFVNDVDRQDLVKTLAEACEKTGWEIHAYCLMRNHFHLVLETPNANRVEGMRWLLGEHGIGQDTAVGRQEFERQMEARRVKQEDAEALQALRRG